MSIPCAFNADAPVVEYARDSHMAPKTIYEFGEFRLDPEARILVQGGKIVPVTPKALELLRALLERPGEVVAKDDLIKAVWPDTFVEESNLTSNISILRKQLGVHPEGGEYIETLPKRGYRFIAEVKQVHASEPKRPSRRGVVLGIAAGLCALLLGLLIERPRVRLPAFGVVPRVESLAVLPLANLSGDPAQEYFADGMTEALTAELAQIGALRVISRTSVMRYKNTKKPLPEIARELKVDAVILGSVLRSSQRVRITAELIQASTDRHLWARTYERSLDDILDLESEIARAIAGEVQAKVTPQEQGRLARNRAVNHDAYEAYLKGRYYENQFTEDSLSKSIEYFEQAIKLDPRYAAAYAGLADGWMHLEAIGAPPEQVHPQALEAATKALQLDDTLGEAHSAMAGVKGHEWDWETAERETQKALQLNPGDAAAHLFHSNRLRRLGRSEESIAEARRALDLDPLSVLGNEQLASSYLSARQYDLAIEQYQKTLELYPNQAGPRDSLGWAYVYKGLYDKGLQEIEKSYGEDPDLSPEVAYVYAVSGNRAKARQILQRLLNLSKQAPIQPHHFALIYAGLGMNEEALVWLEQAYQQHSRMMVWLKVDQRFDRLRPDPRFQDLMRRVGLL
jgi:TolB-like protein/DNA-binding winged helix-turn-helix (wHTH) protein/Tfp pilus assembly protein PilF